jgi:hypothetical protein
VPLFRSSKGNRPGGCDEDRSEGSLSVVERFASQRNMVSQVADDRYGYPLVGA